MNRWASALVGTAMLWAAFANRTLAAPPELPKFSRVEHAVVTAIAGERDFQLHDLIDRTQATEALEAVRAVGWVPRDTKEILAAVPSASNYVVKQLRTPKGKASMRKIARMPSGYDRLFRIGGLKNGRRLVYDVCQGTDGYRLIEYLTESSGGKAMGSMVSGAPHGAHFNQPTGQIYTLPALVKRLKASYEQAQESD